MSAQSSIPGLNSRAELAEVADRLRARLRRPLEERPFAFLGLAAGCGYVLANGLPRPVVSSLIRWSLRTGLLLMANNLLTALAAAEPDVPTVTARPVRRSEGQAAHS